MTIGTNIDVLTSHIGEKEVYAICGACGKLVSTLLLAGVRMCVKRVKSVRRRKTKLLEPVLPYTNIDVEEKEEEEERRWDT